MSNTIDGIHTTTNPKGTGWVNQANGVVVRISAGLGAARQRRDPVQEVSRSEPLGGRHGHRIAEPEPVKLRRQRNVGCAVHLVGGDDRRKRPAA